MRWVGAMFWRTVLFWGTWFALVALALCTFGGAKFDGDDWGRIGRIALFISTMVLLIAETKRLNVALFAIEARMKEAALSPPGRLERLTHGGLPLAVGMLFWGFWLEVLSPWIAGLRAGNGAPNAAAAIGALAWSLASLAVIGLALGGITLARFRWAARRLAASQRPKLGTVIPWTVAAWSTGALTLALFGLPDPRSLSNLAQLAVALLQVGTLDIPATTEAPVDLLVEETPGHTLANIQPLLASVGATSRPAFPALSAADDAVLAATSVVTVPGANANLLALFLELDNGDVARIELNAAVTAGPLVTGGRCGADFRSLPVNDPYGGADLAQMGAADALMFLSRRSPRKPAVVAIVDTGIDGRHEDIRDVMTPRPVADDRDGHGTACAGLAGAVANNGRGIASFNLNGDYVRVRSYPALAAVRPEADDVARAVWDAADDGADVINLSFNGFGQAPDAMVRAVNHALRRGLIVVASAGNNQADAASYWPANIPGVLVVASTSGRARADFSNTTTGVLLAVSAPGQQVCTLNGDGGYTQFDGTSASAPLVSGLLGTMRALCPNLDRSEAIAILMTTGDAVPGLGPAVRADRALDRLAREHPECAGEALYRGRESWAPSAYEGEDDGD